MSKKKATRKKVEVAETAPVQVKRQVAQTPFEAASTPLERLEQIHGKRMDLRPVHPSEVDNRIKKFCEENEIEKRSIQSSYNETGMTLTITWK